MTNKQRIEDLLIEFDEMDMQPMNTITDPIDRAKAWKHELTYAINHLEAEVARETFELVECAFSPVLMYEGHTIKAYIAALKKKYMEGGAKNEES